MPEPLDIVKQIWEHYSPSHPVTQYEKNNLAFELTHRLIHFFQAGDFYVYLFNIAAAEFEYISPTSQRCWAIVPKK